MRRLNTLGVVVTGVAVFCMSVSFGCGSNEDAPVPSSVKSESSAGKGTQASAEKAMAKRVRTELTVSTESMLDAEEVAKTAFLAVETDKSHSQEIVAFEATGERIGPITDDGRLKFDICYSPKTKRIVFISRYERDPNRWDIYSMALDGSDSRNLTLESPPPEEAIELMGRGVGSRVLRNGCPSFTPDGGKVLFHQTTPDGILSLLQVGDLKTAAPAVVLRQGENGDKDTGSRSRPPLTYDDAQLSPDGSLVVCVQRPQGSGGRIGIMNLSASAGDADEWVGFLEFTLEERAQRPRFSPDGTNILYTVSDLKASESNIFLIGVDEIKKGSSTPRFLVSGKRGMTGNWLPEGNGIVIGGDLGDGEQVYKVMIGDDPEEELVPERLSKTPEILRHPVWIR